MSAPGHSSCATTSWHVFSLRSADAALRRSELTQRRSESTKPVTGIIGSLAFCVLVLACGALGGERRDHKNRRFTLGARTIVVTGRCICDHVASANEATRSDRNRPRSDKNRHRNEKRCRPSVHVVFAYFPLNKHVSFCGKNCPIISLDHAKRERKDASASFRPSLVRFFLHPRVIRSSSAPRHAQPPAHTSPRQGHATSPHSATFAHHT